MWVKAVEFHTCRPSNSCERRYSHNGEVQLQASATKHRADWYTVADVSKKPADSTSRAVYVAVLGLPYEACTRHLFDTTVEGTQNRSAREDYCLPVCDAM
jgi:hypothetical protein